MQNIGIDAFVRKLQSIAEPEFTVPGVQAFLEQWSVDPQTLAPYVCFDRQHYTRNLVDRTALYELIAICWEVGQISAVHNHAGQNCWMAVPVGKLMAQNYRVLEQDAGRGHCRLEPTSRFLMTAATPMAVNPEEPVHSVANLAEWNERAVSLHIYSKPFDHCLIYSPEKHTYGQTKLTFHSEFGQTLRS